jgi:hypothetical protein
MDWWNLLRVGLAIGVGVAADLSSTARSSGERLVSQARRDH